MSQIGTLVTGAGIVTNIVGQSKCDQFILLGDVDTSMPLQGLVVEIEGVAFFTIANAATLLAAYAKWQQEMTGATVGVLLKIATGAIYKNTTYRFTNAGVTTPAIFAFSEAPDGIPFYVSTVTVNPLSSQLFEKFSALFIQTPANVASIEVTYRNGYRETMQIVEADARFSITNNSEADGRLGGVSVIDNTDQMIESVKINTNATAGGTAILQAKLPDEAFQALKNLR